MPPFDPSSSRMRIQDLLGGDTQSLRSSYLDYLSSGLDSQQSLEPDSNASIMQGVLPALLAGIFTKGKALAYAGEPLSAVYKSQSERAKNEAVLNQETNLKKSGLVGDELTRRDKMVADEWDDVRDENLKRDLAKQVSEDRRYQTDQTHDDRVMMAGAVAGNRRNADADRDEQRRFQEENRQRDDERTDTKEVDSAFRTRLKDKKVPERKTALDSTRAMLEAGSDISGEQLRGLLVGIRGDNRKSNTDILRAIPSTLQGLGNEVLNKIDGGTRDKITPQQRNALKEILNVYEKEIKRDAIGAKKGVTGLSDTLAPTLKKTGKLDSLLSTIGGEYGVSDLNEEEDGVTSNLKKMSLDDKIKLLGELRARKGIK